MTNLKTTKRALLSSVVALLVCFTMLLGTTFAWFTDSVTSANNIIKSGTLDVEMHWAEGKLDPNANDTAWTDASSGAIFNNDKWEPGYVEVRHIKISNVGTLALKYQLHIYANGDVSDLADVIDVYFVDPAVQVADRTALGNIEPVGTLTEVLAGMPGNASGDLQAEEVDTITLALKMRENAGNEYQNKEIGSDFVIQLLATQLTAESDSFDDQYDANAEFLSVNESVSIVNNNGTLGEEVVLTADMPYGTIKVTVPAGAQLSSADISSLKLTVKNADPYVRGTLDANKVANGYVIYVDGISDYKNPYFNADADRTLYNSKHIMVEFPVGAGRKDLTSLVNGTDMTMTTPYRTYYAYDADTGVVSFGASGFADFSTHEPSNFTFVYTKLSEAEKLLNSAIETLTSGGTVAITSTENNMVSWNNIADALDGASNVVLVGEGKDETVMNSDWAKINADSLTIKDMSISAAGSYGMTITGNGTVIDNVDYVAVREVDGLPAATTNYGLEIAGSNSVVKNSRIVGTENATLYFTNASDTVDSVTVVDTCIIENYVLEHPNFPGYYFRYWGNNNGLRFQALNGTLEVKNTTIDVAGYGFEVGPTRSLYAGDFVIENSTVNASSNNITRVNSATLTNVTFGNVTDPNGIEVNTAALTFGLGGKTNTFTGCNFTCDVAFESRANLNAGSTISIVFDNCKYNGVDITADNILDHFTFKNFANNSNYPTAVITVNGETVTLP
ncbi:MAG: hypothetical protein J6J66_07610 [Clostridia bacterium]|nr:hypothetical protein [Clostridia bacterium]